ncbi:MULTISPECIES: glycosyltransferase family 2 protein [unclassified Gordonia (in: high G+C Gram-positive bacteria)]|uniref:glycosyltransferase family 2 protein n=1 Tax=unclassified Gordonia (in: high G+C Gram-positive bacteria) TaxID=2657482 RepID=UPI0007EAAB9B|nr:MULTISPECIES: glycosyltransferase family 2 protein [unclassified Gordonia (in: high G+C Gram-positive bacteria)]OBC06793.1 glycosyl transferase [Gordonia sp. 852002-50395_SCH5434458]OBC13935.1 glycosyl transferase [Gordonia sp. 852002-50816_SCH5313054-c]OBC18682.1 glycosyl transferase [Gordonia sp. 852002-50816_SCH5313054-a]
MTERPTNDDVWLVIPVYNEGEVIRDVLVDASKTFPNIVCVDDGSSDDSVAQIRSAAADVARTQTGSIHLVRHPVNLGQGAAIQTGVEYARSRPGAQYFVTFDADGQHRVDDVVAMIDRLRTEPVDIIVGTRFADGRSESVPLLRRIVLRTVVFLSPRTRRLGLSDAHNGLRAFNKTVADQLDLLMAGMSHASEFVALIDHHHWRVAEQPVTILYTDYSRAKGQSLINGVNIVADGLLHGRMRR